MLVLLVVVLVEGAGIVVDGSVLVLIELKVLVVTGMLEAGTLSTVAVVVVVVTVVVVG